MRYLSLVLLLLMSAPRAQAQNCSPTALKPACVGNTQQTCVAGRWTCAPPPPACPPASKPACGSGEPKCLLGAWLCPPCDGKGKFCTNGSPFCINGTWVCPPPCDPKAKPKCRAALPSMCDRGKWVCP